MALVSVLGAELGSQGARHLARDPLSRAQRVILNCRYSSSDVKNHTIIFRCFSGLCGTPGTKAIFVKVREGPGGAAGRGRGEADQHGLGTYCVSGTGHECLRSLCLTLSTMYQVGAVTGEKLRLRAAEPPCSGWCLQLPTPSCFFLTLPRKRQAVTQPQLGKLHLILSVLWGLVTQSILL